jgi:hypothetical protein
MSPDEEARGREQDKPPAPQPPVDHDDAEAAHRQDFEEAVRERLRQHDRGEDPA